ncbi:MAG: hypothetical protein ACREN5_04030 [Gemmatimonadales bacterium]
MTGGRAVRRYGGLVILLAACAEPTIPTRPLSYNFADTVIVGPDTVVTVFRWGENRLPVRVFADARGYLRAAVQRGLGAWEAQFLYGEFRGALTEDSAGADVVVVWTGAVPPDAQPGDTSTAFACDGVSIFPPVDPTDSLTDAIQVQIDLVGSFPPAVIADCVYRTTVHELGHTLGLLRHSTFATNILFAPPRVARPNDGDRRTVEVLYHTEPTIFPRPR